MEIASAWRKSGHSGGSGDDCAEVAFTWHKSSHSSGDGDDCIEVAPIPAAIHVRDSKRPDGARLTMNPTPWSEFLTLVRAAP
nr:DUF397 domain-containing protein [Streptomyces silvensis]